MNRAHENKKPDLKVNPYSGGSRRSFLKKATLAGMTLAGSELSFLSGQNSPSLNLPDPELPWFRRTTRWGQTNITEIDPSRYDIPWWRKYWKRTKIHGVIINAGGIVAYYPSKINLHRQAQFLGGRDLFGELCLAAHEDGLAVFARMDSNRAHEEFYKAHPGWFAVDATGKPYRAAELYITCVNSPYYNEHIPEILKEIASIYHPEGFTDNSWSGLGRESICYCENCQKKFHEFAGMDIPDSKNWDDRAYRLWIRWNYNRRIEIWDLNNRVSKSAGGEHCIWAGMNSGSISGQSRSFRDYKEICNRAEIIMLDSQARNDAEGFQHNGGTGKLIHGLLGWDKLIPESMAMYQAGRPTFRLARKPEPEARMWILEGFAGGIQPWWHHISAYHEDRRTYQTAEPLFTWHKKNESFMLNRKPIAPVGVVWSQQNVDFYGRDNAENLVDLPLRGITQALIRARIPYIPVHADHIERDGEQLSLLILPNFAAVTDEQISSIRRFVQQGGSLFATGQSTLFNEWGDPRPDYALSDLFGAHITKAGRSYSDFVQNTRTGDALHTYMRLSPELRRQVDGPQTGKEPLISGKRHPILQGFEETDILGFGGHLDNLRTDPGSEVLMTFIPEFPIYPPETAWMREPVTDIPGLLIRTTPSGSRIAFMPADIDRQFGRYNLPDHGNLLANIIRWAAGDSIPISIKGPGLIDVHLYEQKERMIIHLVNLTSSATWRQPVDELISVGPFQVNVKLPAQLTGRNVQFLVSGKSMNSSVKNGWISFEINNILDHEVAVIA